MSLLQIIIRRLTPSIIDTIEGVSEKFRANVPYSRYVYKGIHLRVKLSENSVDVNIKNGSFVVNSIFYVYVLGEIGRAGITSST